VCSSDLGVCSVFAQGYLIRIVVPWLGEQRTVFVGYLISALAFILLPFVTAGWVLYVGIFFHIMGHGCASPTLTALMSRNVPDGEQGLLQGTIGSVNTISMIVGPIFATQIFALSTGSDALFALSGAFYFFGAGLFAFTVILLALNGFQKRTI